MYNVLVTIHILIAGIWLSNLLLGLSIKLKDPKGVSGNNNLILFYLKYSNIVGVIGAIGILITGIYMTAVNPAYSFFQFSANHWLASKQVVMVIILAIVFSMLIPNAKIIKKQIKEGSSTLDSAILSKLNKIAWTINLLVILNILFALSRRLM